MRALLRGLGTQRIRFENELDNDDKEIGEWWPVLAGSARDSKRPEDVIMFCPALADSECVRLRWVQESRVFRSELCCQKEVSSLPPIAPR